MVTKNFLLFRDSVFPQGFFRKKKSIDINTWIIFTSKQCFFVFIIPSPGFLVFSEWRHCVNWRSQRWPRGNRSSASPKICRYRHQRTGACEYSAVSYGDKLINPHLCNGSRFCCFTAIIMGFLYSCQVRQK